MQKNFRTGESEQNRAETVKGGSDYDWTRIHNLLVCKRTLLGELLSVRLRTKLSGCRFESSDSQGYTNADLKISLYIQVHVKIIP